MSQLQSTNIFITGGTGYLGGTILIKLLGHPDFVSFNITALFRNAEKMTNLNNLGIKTVTGSLTDLKLLEDSASRADIVFNLADSDDLYATRAILRGLMKRCKSTGVQPHLIQTSNNENLLNILRGFHIGVDLQIVQADEQNHVRTYIVLPDALHGVATRRPAEVETQHARSAQTSTDIRATFYRGQKRTSGDEGNRWDHVRPDNVANLYIVLFNSIRTDPVRTPHGREGFYFGGNGEYRHISLSIPTTGQAGQSLMDLGKPKSVQRTTSSRAESTEVLGPLHVPAIRTRAPDEADGKGVDKRADAHVEGADFEKCIIGSFMY